MNDLMKNKNYVIEQIGNILVDQTRPMKERFRALFTLKNIGGETSIHCIERCFDDPSVLLKHECAYCLGQMGDSFAVPKLESILKNTAEDPIVRHEAGEALAAIGKESSLEILQNYIDDPCVEVSETCQLAVQKMKHNTFMESKVSRNPYYSVDPAPPYPLDQYSTTELESILLDENRSLYDRYRAMFSLRNMESNSAALSLAKGLDCGSALYRHEIAYILGQMQKENTVQQLAKLLCDETQHEMVRHECAEALGSIATEECMEILARYLTDERTVVRESCEVALDMCDYENNKEFQYANALLKISS
ncbi:deoxyhypusine hydroxylase-like [Uloborus diversus]|uniref:deoxyhypusine hydroxylase-like n=1 Tax=Uloborus diversus TaxID=327109 RepID=UPI002409300C|nr:deoxyhypusine hydroxylase-like [Uloborus diversus]